MLRCMSIGFPWSASVLGTASLFWMGSPTPQGPVDSHRACVNQANEYVLALKPRERKTNPQRDQERVLVKKKAEIETWKTQRKSIFYIPPLHLPVTPILPGSYCRRSLTSCAQVLSRVGGSPQRHRQKRQCKMKDIEKKRASFQVLISYS